MIKQISGRGSNAAPVVRLRLVMVVAACFLNACQTVQNRRSPAGKQNVLVLMAGHDPTGSFEGLESTLSNNLRNLPGIEPTFQRIDGLAEFRESILSRTDSGARLHALILAFHGQPNRLYLGASETLHQRNLRDHCKDLHLALHPDAPVILYSCLTGEGEDNLAADLATHLKRPVVAPNYYWLMQTAVPPGQRVSELELDARGRLTIARARFALYYKKRHRTYRDRHLIAPTAMDALCQADGFLPQPSRFRRLFQRFTP